jgi:hypothetical protein
MPPKRTRGQALSNGMVPVERAVHDGGSHFQHQVRALASSMIRVSPLAARGRLTAPSVGSGAGRRRLMLSVPAALRLPGLAALVVVAGVRWR